MTTSSSLHRMLRVMRKRSSRALDALKSHAINEHDYMSCTPFGPEH